MPSGTNAAYKGAEMTAEERAAEITKGWGAIATTNFSAPGSYPPVLFIENGGEWARDLIADAIRAAVAEERERCASACDRIAWSHQNSSVLGPELNASKCAATIRKAVPL